MEHSNLWYTSFDGINFRDYLPHFAAYYEWRNWDRNITNKM